QSDVIARPAQEAVPSMLDDMPVAGNVRRDQRPGHGRRLQQRTRKALAIGWQYHRGSCDDERTDVLGMPDIFYRGFGNPPIELGLADCRSIFLVQRAEQLESPIRMLRPQQPCRLDELAHALVAKQAADKQEPNPARLGRGREMAEVDARTGKEPALLGPYDPAFDKQGAIVGILKEDDRAATK